MDPPLTDDDIHRISLILSGDAEAVRDKEKIYGELGLSWAELEDIKRSSQLDGSYSFFKTILIKYKSKNGSNARVQILAQKFIELKIQNVAEALNSMQKCSTPRRSEAPARRVLIRQAASAEITPDHDFADAQTSGRSHQQTSGPVPTTSTIPTESTLPGPNVNRNPDLNQGNFETRFSPGPSPDSKQQSLSPGGSFMLGMMNSMTLGHPQRNSQPRPFSDQEAFLGGMMNSMMALGNNRQRSYLGTSDSYDDDFASDSGLGSFGFGSSGFGSSGLGSSGSGSSSLGSSGLGSAGLGSSRLGSYRLEETMQPLAGVDNDQSDHTSKTKNVLKGRGSIG